MTDHLTSYRMPDPACRELWRGCGVGKRHAEADPVTLRAFAPWGEALDRVRGVCDSGGIVVILGDRGRGKTQLAAEVCREWCSRGRSARYLRACEVGVWLRQGFGVAATEEQQLKRLTRAGVLVLDEFQDRITTEWETHRLTAAIDARYADKRPTIIIGNMTPEGFKQVAGASIVDRIHETGGVVECRWQSFRRSSNAVDTQRQHDALHGGSAGRA